MPSEFKQALIDRHDTLVAEYNRLTGAAPAEKCRAMLDQIATLEAMLLLRPWPEDEPDDDETPLEPDEPDYDPGPSLMDQYRSAWQSKFGPGGTHRRSQ